MARDWETAREIFTAAAPEEHSYYVTVAAGCASVEEWIDGPVRAEPGSTLPLLIRGARYVSWAWEARGSGGSDTVSEDAWSVWFNRLRKAEDCLDEVVERDPGSAEAWRYLITLGRARQLPKEELRRRFDGLIAADPTHYSGHRQMLEGLMRKWSGSAEEMFDFARTRSAACPGTHIPVLVPLAHIEHAQGRNGTELQEYLQQDEVIDEIWDASQQSVFHADYQESLLTPIVWNTFAYTLALGGQINQAGNILDVIGEDWITRAPWNSMSTFVKIRDHVTASRDDPDE
ncbi:hypothetical protein [Actinoplanes couchii]|uniref:DUF4034 domain-containing protein n=1 Tax=Actinoplanes couchii TaxID=403638 RepID=A0ABQ3XAS3_9ACTN|nr:hypothetical protein [Actinoplanes couchii]MDR6323103.1 hypothetical protein [Actinoplanes couchii]GID55617.1 hypothetical protein Aco03nite_040210 [Actinoplanes couchii]